MNETIIFDTDKEKEQIIQQFQNIRFLKISLPKELALWYNHSKYLEDEYIHNERLKILSAFDSYQMLLRKQNNVVNSQNHYYKNNDEQNIITEVNIYSNNTFTISNEEEKNNLIKIVESFFLFFTMYYKEEYNISEINEKEYLNLFDIINPENTDKEYSLDITYNEAEEGVDLYIEIF